MIFAHISDLHINTEIVNSHLRQAEALINSALEQGAEHFIITGDVSDKALAEDFRRLRELLKKYKLLDPQKLSMVIGNHDIFGGVSHAEDIFTFPEKCRTTDYSQGIYSFNNYFEEAFAECIYRSGDGSGYPFAKRIGQCLLIGLNSIQEYSSIKNPFASNGKICDRQKEELKKILMYFGDTVKYRILMV
ncbi:MAG: metallophosphoesterase, partial [Ignavibacteriales bacterium]|nr:metallophosphoesterase [Ignavibacteriales bacterium]